MHMDGIFQAPPGYSTKGIDFRNAYIRREADNQEIMHAMHQREEKKAKAAEAVEHPSMPGSSTTAAGTEERNPPITVKSTAGWLVQKVRIMTQLLVQKHNY